MDDLYHIPLAPRKDTPSLCSNATLWEMDDIDPSEPLLPQTTISTKHAGRSNRTSMDVAPLSHDADAFAPLYQRYQPASDATAHQEALTGSRGLFGPHRAYINQVKSNNRQATIAERLFDNHSPLDFKKRDIPGHTYARVPAGLPSEMSFMEWYPKGDATISYLNDNGEAQSIAEVNVQAIQQTCPLLGAAFEPRNSGPQLHLEILNEATALPFLRYLYTGSYAINGESGDVYEDVPTSLLLHCRLYHLGHVYDLPMLMQQANVNIIRQCEFGCSSPDKPIQLVAAIKYAYEHLQGHTGVLDTIISYCIACYLRHHLADDGEFRQIAFELKPFHQALCRESLNRDLDDESMQLQLKHYLVVALTVWVPDTVLFVYTASAIIRMPFKRDAPDFYLSREDVLPSRIRDVVHHFHGGDRFDKMKPERPVWKTDLLQRRDHSPEEKQQLSALKSIADYQTSLMLSEAQNAKRHALYAPRALESEQAIDRDDEPTHNGDHKQKQSNAADAGDLELNSSSDYDIVSSPASVESFSSENDTDTDDLDQSSTTPREVALPIRRLRVVNVVENETDTDNAPAQTSTTPQEVAMPIRRLRVVNSTSSIQQRSRSSSVDNASGSSDSEWSLL